MSTKYIIYNNIKAYDTNGTNCYFVYGCPSILSFLSFSDVLRRNLVNDFNLSINNVSIMPILHDYKMKSEYKALHPQANSNFESIDRRFFASTLKSDQKIDLFFSFVLKLDVDEDMWNDLNEDNAYESIDHVHNIMGSRFFEINKKDVFVFNDENELKNKLLTIKRGYCYSNIGMNELFEKELEKLKCSSKVLITSQMYSKNDSKDGFKGVKGLVKPSLIGYNIINDISDKDIFVEPVVGFIEFVNFKSKIRKDQNKEDNIFNYFFKQKKHGTFLTYENINKEK